jgi:uncharacterized protein YceK
VRTGFRFALLLATASLSGCATYQTLTNNAPDGGGGLFSGTRYNLALMRGDADALIPYSRCSPPPYPPAIDLPLSFAADTLAAATRIFLVPLPTATGYRAMDQR